jgi:galactokinase
VLGDPEAVIVLKGAIGGRDHGGFTSADLARRLDHFLAEDARVPLAALAFERADRPALGELARESQTDAERLLGNQVPETTDLVEAARACGAYAASSFGAGFGGSAWAVVAVGDASDFGAEWLAAYRARRPERGSAPWFAARPGPGVVSV